MEKKRSGLNKGIRSAAGPRQSVEEALRELKQGSRKKEPGYREQSLKLHGTVCARCGAEFGGATLHLLTVHHKDNNPNNNPPDGSNWENLCAYCHEAEHSRELLGDYEDGGSSASSGPSESAPALGSMADLFNKARKK